MCEQYPYISNHSHHSLDLIMVTLCMSYYEIKRLPQLDPVIFMTPPLQSPQVCCITPSYLDNFPISALIYNNPVLSIYGPAWRYFSEAGGSANAQPLKEEKGNLIKMIQRNGTYHGVIPP
jgi:hypothetical protein